MNTNITCPCCDSSMLLHLSSRRSFWLCNHCRQEIPNSNKQVNDLQPTPVKWKPSVFTQTVSSPSSTQKIAAV